MIRSPRCIAALVGALCAVVGFAACGSGQGRALTDDLGELVIEVTENGQTRRASVYCGLEPRSTGYLADPKAMSAACLTATMSWSSMQFVEHGRGPTRKRCNVPMEHEGATARIRGHWSDDDIDRTLHVKTTCDASLWRDLLPLFEPQEQGVIVHEQAW